MKAWMYFGRYFRRRNNFTQASICFSHAETLAQESTDHHARGLVYSWQGELYRIQRDYATELEYEEKSVREFTAAADSSNRLLSLAYLALALQRNQQWARSDSLYEQMLPALIQDTLCASVFLSYYAQSQVLRPDETANPEKAVSLLEMKQGLDLPLSLTDVSFQALAMAQRGDTGSCQHLLEILDRQGPEIMEQASYIRYRIARALGQYDRAIPLLERTYVRQDSLVTQLLSQSLAQSLKNHYETESRQQQEHLERLRLRTLLLFFLSASASICVFVWISARKRRQLEEKNRMLRLAEEANKMLEVALQEKAQSAQDPGAAQAELRRRYAEMYKKQYLAIGSLCDSYFSPDSSLEQRKERVYAKVSSLLAYISTDMTLHARFEEQVNQEMNNILSDLRKDLGNLKENDSRVLCYHLVGFSTSTIANILGTTPNSVYIRLSRLRDRIQKLDSPRKEFYLQVI